MRKYRFVVVMLMLMLIPLALLTSTVSASPSPERIHKLAEDIYDIANHGRLRTRNTLDNFIYQVIMAVTAFLILVGLPIGVLTYIDEKKRKKEKEKERIEMLAIWNKSRNKCEDDRSQALKEISKKFGMSTFRVKQLLRREYVFDPENAEHADLIKRLPSNLQTRDQALLLLVQTIAEIRDKKSAS